MTKSYEYNKLGFGFRLPNLPKQDYLVLKKQCDEWNMTMVQMVLLGLRVMNRMPGTLSEAEFQELVNGVTKDV